MRYCSHLGLSRPNSVSSAWRSAGDACGTRDRSVTALPGSTRNRKKLIVIATKIVTRAKKPRLITQSVPRTRSGPVHAIHGDYRHRVERAAPHLRQGAPVAALRLDRVRVVDH